MIASTLAFTACTPSSGPGQTATVSQKTTTTVMWNQPFYGYNNATSFGNATANTNIIYMTNDAVTYYDGNLKVVTNKSFGTYEKVSDTPLSVKVKLADTATWSDGTAVTAADLVLAYGAQSGLFNTITDEKEVEGLANEDGTLKPAGEGKVYFDSSSASLALITKFPEISSDSKEFTYTYDTMFADWDKAIITPGLPAHIVAKRALGIAQRRL